MRPDRPPRSAATVVLVARHQALMVERAKTLHFLGGFHGFPGGVVDNGDENLPGDCPDEGGKRAAALRELFEETGLLLIAGDSDPLSLPEDWARVVGGELSFAGLLEERGATLGTARLIEAGNWLTPEFSLRRFDTWFFIVPLHEVVPVEVHSGEVEKCEWLEAGEALTLWKKHRIMMVPPTLNMLRAIRDGRDAAHWAEKARAVPQARAIPERRIESRFGMILFPMKTNTLPPANHTTTILFGEGEMIIIDPASPDKEEQDQLLRLVKELEREGRQAKEIVLTHHHDDHIGAVERLREELDLPVAAHMATALLLRGKIRVDRSIEEGDLIALAGPGERKLEVLHTPGHAPGHLCFFERETGTLIAGDNVLGHGSVLIDPPHGNMTDYLRSLRRMKALGSRILVGGHGEIVGDPEREIERYIAHRLSRERMILGVLLEGPQSPSEIVRRVYTDVPVEMHPLAERSVLAHLERLVERSLASEERGQYVALVDRLDGQDDRAW